MMLGCLCKNHVFSLYEPPPGKTNNVVSEQVGHKPGCTSTKDGYRLEILAIERRGIVLSV